MTVVADTSALVSLGTVADSRPNPLDVLLAEFRVVVPDVVDTELAETAEYDDPSGNAASAVLQRRDELDVRSTTLDDDFPLDDGENAAVSLANDLEATQLLCDEFNRLALVHASLVETRLLTTPTLLAAFVRTGRLSRNDAAKCLSEMRRARSWENNAYVERASETLREVR